MPVNRTLIISSQNTIYSNNSVQVLFQNGNTHRIHNGRIGHLEQATKCTSRNTACFHSIGVSSSQPIYPSLSRNEAGLPWFDFSIRLVRARSRTIGPFHRKALVLEGIQTSQGLLSKSTRFLRKTVDQPRRKVSKRCMIKINIGRFNDFARNEDF